MARTKAKAENQPDQSPAEKRKPGPKPDPSRVRIATTLVRSSEGWKAEVEALAEHDRAPSVSDLIDRAVAAYARSIQYPKPIPKR